MRPTLDHAWRSCTPYIRARPRGVHFDPHQLQRRESALAHDVIVDLACGSRRCEVDAVRMLRVGEGDGGRRGRKEVEEVER